MENLYHFSPLWERLELISKPEKAIEELRIKSLEAFLHKNRSEPAKSLSLDEIVLECTSIIEQLLQITTDDNEILRRLREYEQDDPIAIVRSSLVLWYAASSPIFSRDPHQGLPPDSELEDDNGEPILAWSRRFFHKQHAIGNLGLMAMLMTSETWLSPKNERLKAASLISAASTTIMFASHLICTEVMHTPWAKDVCPAQSSEAMTLFIRSSWQVARQNCDIFDSPPGREFGATLREVKLSDNGKRFLTKIGRESWQEAPYWHPCRRVPGSCWNKYLKNTSRPVFPNKSTDNNKVHISLPNTMFSLVQPWETYYAELRNRFDQTGRHRRIISPASQEAQYERLAKATGHPYPSRKLSPQLANHSINVEQEYLLNMPLIKKPVVDFRGNLTFPFMTTALRAVRFQIEPEEIARTFSIVSFW